MVDRRPMMILVFAGLIALAAPPAQTGWEVPADAVGEAAASAGSSQLKSVQFDGLPAPLVAIPSAARGGGSPGANLFPFDPLSPEEQHRAIRLALADGSVGPGRQQVIGAALYTDKAFLDLDLWPRMAEVWVYDYARDSTVQVLVDLGLGAVASVSILDVDPPLAAAELRRAGTLALADARTLQRLAAQGIDADDVRWTARLWGGPAPAACAEHRCALVAMTDGPTFLSDTLVVVDLSAQQVAGLLDAQYRSVGGAASP